MFPSFTSIRELTRLYSKPEFDDIRIPLRDINLATKRFAEENLLKRGGEADVYKGVLLLKSKLGIDVVIRRYKRKRYNFYDGIEVLRGLRHRNVASFIGICDEGNEQMIVMEHVVNGSLEKYVSDPTTLPWSQRLHICFGAAFALKYWKHKGEICYLVSTKGFKVLLNKYWEAKVVFDPGTEPRYETDSASLGCILLEVMYGRKATIEDVNQYVAHKELDDHMIDPNLRKQMYKQSLSIFSELAYMCLKERRYQCSGRQIVISDIVARLKEAFEIQWKHENFLVKQTIWDLEQSATFIGKHDEDYHSEPETSPTYPKRRQRRHMSCSALNKEMVASSSTITDQIPYPKKG